MSIERADILVSYNCNNNCVFCVINKSERNYKKRTLKQIKKEILYCKKKYNCNSITFTGGDPCINKDIFEIVKYAKKLRYETIQIQTNGRMLAYEDFARKLVEAGVNSFTISLHAHNSKLGNMLSKTKKSFEQTVLGIKNIKKFNVNLITNTVVCKQNYRDLEKIVKLAIKVGANQIQIVFIRSVGEAHRSYDSVVPKISEVMPYIKKSIELCRKKNVRCLVEGVPYCLMKGYGKNIAERYMQNSVVKAGKLGLYKSKTKERKIKFLSCDKCKKFEDCTGIWINYGKKEGEKEFKPIL